MAGPSPQGRATKLLESHGYLVDVVERISRRGNMTWRNDLFGGFDLMAVDEQGKVLVVQVTSRSNVSARVIKVNGLPIVERFRKAGVIMQVWGWGKTKTKGDWQIVDI